MLNGNGCKGGLYVNKWLYVLYIFVLAAVSIVTGEIITFIMLGMILIALNNIHSTLKRMMQINQGHK